MFEHLDLDLLNCDLVNALFVADSAFGISFSFAMRFKSAFFLIILM
jgi:hypothetical protein